MARKNQVILLHGNKDFKINKPSDFVKGELAIEHGSNDAKLFTLNDANEVVTFVSETVVNEKVKVATDAAGTNASAITAINGQLETIKGDEATDGSIAKALKDAKEYADSLAENYDAAGAAATAKSEVIGTSDDASTVNTIYGAKKYADEKSSAAQTAAEGAAANAEKNAKDYADSLVLNADRTAKFDAAGAAATAKSEVIGTPDDASTADTIYGAKAYADEGATSKITILETQINGEIDTIKSDIETLQTAVGDETEGTGLYKKIADAQAAATSVVSSTSAAIKVTPETATDGHVEYKLSLEGIATTEGLAELQGQVETLIGSDSDREKSVRKIANEELASVLIDGANNGAEDNFKTLKELADWLEKHPEDAAAMNSAIEQNATDIATANGNITKNAAAIETLQGKDADTKESVSIVGVKKYADSLVKGTDGANLFDDKGAASAVKSEVIGTSDDASTDDTIYGAKKYADAKAAEEAGKVQTNLNSVAENYIKTIKDAKENTFSATNNIVDLSTMVIDCGEY